MHQQLTSRVLSLADSLNPGEALVFHNFIVCRTKGGKLRFAAAENGMNASWYRGEFAALVAEHVEAVTDYLRAGYFASRSRTNIEGVIERPRPVAIEGVGRRFPQFEATWRL